MIEMGRRVMDCSFLPVSCRRSRGTFTFPSASGPNYGVTVDSPEWELITRYILSVRAPYLTASLRFIYAW